MWQWLNPLNLIKILSLIKAIFDGVMAIYKGYKERKEEVKSQEDDQKTASEAVEEIRKPLDPTKSVEEREKDAEAAFKKFHDKLKRN